MRWAPLGEMLSSLGSSLARQLRDTRGAVTAEFAVIIPAIVVVLGLAIGGITLSTHRLTLTSAAADIARLEARGDTQAAASRASKLGTGVQIIRENSEGVWCVTLTDHPGQGLLSFIEIAARGCAAMSGEHLQ